MRHGICVPSGCSPSDIQEVLDSLTKENYWNATVKRCELKQENEYTPLIMGVMWFEKAFDMQQQFFFSAVVNASVAVDTFFFIGGLLVCYVTMNVMKEKKSPLISLSTYYTAYLDCTLFTSW
ncbi:nose resistant to fluoxetine protein 6 [Caerostris extrusa]|uniref:Nose resistant to fluoxetine protein 6 n=1 Tax=Caerostris extrusa TaxID=172846 RepID=A0AAV4NMS4_CAEEX|nr:nose resistant to fluoxetine protein 6 [Caerostris extrusa]